MDKVDNRLLILLFTHEAIRTARSAVHLATMGYPAQAETLNRALFEQAIACEYFREFPPQANRLIEGERIEPSDMLKKLKREAPHRYKFAKLRGILSDIAHTSPITLALYTAHFNGDTMLMAIPSDDTDAKASSLEKTIMGLMDLTNGLRETFDYTLQHDNEWRERYNSAVEGMDEFIAYLESEPPPGAA